MYHTNYPRALFVSVLPLKWNIRDWNIWNPYGNPSTSEHPNGQGSCVGNSSPSATLDNWNSVNLWIDVFLYIFPGHHGFTTKMFWDWADFPHVSNINIFFHISKSFKIHKKHIRNPTRPQKIQQVAPVVSEPWGEGPQRIRQSEAARPKDPTFSMRFHGI